ncbi:MAG: amidohydrolase family protein [Coprothermobacterota bacterium]|nr:amidohydrolase family protein [Coprothermobacterota bacterium]
MSKCGLAYDRSLRFDKVTQQKAERAFNKLFADCTLPDWRPPIKAARPLSDWMMHFVCRVADDNQLVYQIHTGLQEGNGNVIYDSNPTLLTNLFLEYRQARFDLFHMGYPYVMELGNLAKNFRNVFIDMCWGHIISPEAARRAFFEWLDAVPANKISAFGGDYCFVDGVYGHQLLARQNVASAPFSSYSNLHSS